MIQSFVICNFQKPKFRKLILFATPVLLVLSGCGTTSEQKIVNDYPTRARVEYVVECMNQHGGQSYQTLYPCVCSVDKIASSMSYDEYSEADAFTRLRGFPGERGGLFRDAPRATELRKRLKETKNSAAESCNLNP